MYKKERDTHTEEDIHSEPDRQRDIYTGKERDIQSESGSGREQKQVAMVTDI